MDESEVSYDERMQASAIHFLISENEKEAALTLLSCTAKLVWDDTSACNLYLRGPRYIYETLKNEESSLRESIKNAFQAIFEPGEYICNIYPLANLVDVEPN